MIGDVGTARTHRLRADTAPTQAKAGGASVIARRSWMRSCSWSRYVVNEVIHDVKRSWPPEGGTSLMMETGNRRDKLLTSAPMMHTSAVRAYGPRRLAERAIGRTEC